MSSDAINKASETRDGINEKTISTRVSALKNYSSINYGRTYA